MCVRISRNCAAKVRKFPHRAFTLVDKKLINSFFPVSYLSKKFQICAKYALQHTLEYKIRSLTYEHANLQIKVGIHEITASNPA